MALDIVESAENWACLELETFKRYIGGVPRPGIYNNGEVIPCPEVARSNVRFLAQFGRLTKLREITLGMVNYESANHQAHWDEKRMEGEYYSDTDYELGSQYQCLSMSLQDRLDELKGLKCLRRLTLERMMLDMGEAEHMWMKENWPEYEKESKDSLWTERGHNTGVGTCLYYEKFQVDYEAEKALETYDWW